MCELLGLSFNERVSPKLSFRGFRNRGERNPHGWGLAYFPDRSVQVIKEPVEAGISHLSEFLKGYEAMESNLFIAHVRITSAGERAHRNTHPFQRELGGKEYVFAHNGTLHGTADLNTGRFTPVGETDSEYAFCRIMEAIRERNVNQWKKEDLEWLSRLLKDINALGNFNCIFSDGEYLFCYHDINGYNGLSYVRREAPFDRIRLKDEDFMIDLHEEKDPSQRGYVIATHPLTDEPWVRFRRGELVVFKRGEMVYRSGVVKIEQDILRVLRSHTHRVAVGTICEETGLSREKVVEAVHGLKDSGYIRQDSRDTVHWDHDEATYYTLSERRDEIDDMLEG